MYGGTVPDKTGLSAVTPLVPTVNASNRTLPVMTVLKTLPSLRNVAASSRPQAAVIAYEPSTCGSLIGPPSGTLPQGGPLGWQNKEPGPKTGLSADRAAPAKQFLA